jgi:hypothetical protein
VFGISTGEVKLKEFFKAIAQIITILETSAANTNCLDLKHFLFFSLRLNPTLDFSFELL